MVRPPARSTRAETPAGAGALSSDQASRALETNGGARSRRRVRLVCRGTVQGVGFRPTAHRLARALGLAGLVRNDAEGATLELEGDAHSIAEFQRRLASELPPLARLVGVTEHELEPTGQVEFEVESSRAGARRGALVPPDARICAECRRELDDPSDRRFRYPFTTCMHCGPRFSLVHGLPYDRERTSMARFALCPFCAEEYADIADRRYHAEPVCCPVCGPRVELIDGAGNVFGGSEHALQLARELLERGGIVALKGLGGYQIACRADDASAIQRLRAAKQRPSKPFAVMVRDLQVASELVGLTRADLALLDSARAPIVLAPRRAGNVAQEVAPGLDDLGVMLPTTPLHVELFRGAGYDALVMTSGNRSDEPICRSDEEARARLATLCDAQLRHEREVVRRCDDSVARSGERGPFVVRRSRGYVPEPLALPTQSHAAVLALGAHLQNTVALAVEGQAFPSQHVGDLDTETAREFQLEVLRGLEEFLDCRASVIAVDLHPDYASTWLGEQLAAARGAELVRVQHHVAHAAAVLAEAQAWPRGSARVGAIVFDGTGFGPDGNAWGAEWLELASDASWRRIAHGDELPLIGGELAVREPWRVATAVLARAGLLEQLREFPWATRVDGGELAAVARLALSSSFPRACGAGRVFEAAGAMLGVCAVNGYEGEAAARFEALAGRARGALAPWGEVRLERGLDVLPTRALLEALARRWLAGRERELCAAEFQLTLAELAAELTQRIWATGVVALAGGCFVNRLLREQLGVALIRRGFRVVVPTEVPCGDGGIAFGQCVVATARQARKGAD